MEEENHPQNRQRVPEFGVSLRWHVCRILVRKMFSELRIFLQKNAPKFLGLSLVGPKNPAKIPAKFPRNFPARNLKKSPTSFCRSAGREFLRSSPEFLCIPWSSGGEEAFTQFGSLLKPKGRFLAERSFCGFLFLGRRIFSRISSPDLFSSFLWEKVPRKILQENPRQNPPKKFPDTFLQRGQSTQTRIYSNENLLGIRLFQLVMFLRFLDNLHMKCRKEVPLDR